MRKGLQKRLKKLETKAGFDLIELSTILLLEDYEMTYEEDGVTRKSLRPKKGAYYAEVCEHGIPREITREEYNHIMSTEDIIATKYPEECMRDGVPF